MSNEKRNIRTLTPSRERTAARYKAVKDRYAELSKIEVKGMRLRYNDIIEKMATEFFLATATIEHILARID